MRNRGGRPAHHTGETKKAAIAVRTAPSIRAALGKAADDAGRSITQEVEARLIASFERDAGERSVETEQLLNKIAAAILDVEKLTGKRWHKDRRTAGAVMQMLDGIWRWIQTDDPAEDELVSQAFERLEAIRSRRMAIVEFLGSIGLYSEGSYDGKAALHVGEVGRLIERHRLHKADLPENVRAKAATLIEELEEADKALSAASAAFNDAIRPYRQAEDEGRALYLSNERMKGEQWFRNFRAETESALSLLEEQLRALGFS